ncbi:LON peptidase substrate-binding domain-containing protein [Alphaproteobacteria bacterium LSUCC0684]
MKRSAIIPDLQDLPETIPVFPLNGALLLPGGRLPLNIFEPRYLNMISDVLTSPTRLMGMIQSTTSTGQNEVAPSLFSIGCVGRLSSFEETTDGRYLISLDGVIRFRVESEIDMKDGYRRLKVDYSTFTDDLLVQDNSINREKLLKALRRFFDLKGFTADWEAIKVCESEKLVTTLSMICPLEVSDKQALLEAPTTFERAEILTTMLEMQVSSHGLISENQGHVRH